MGGGTFDAPHGTGNGALNAYPVRVAVVGLGYWGPNLVRNLHELPDAELVTVCDLRADALESVKRRYPAVNVTQSGAKHNAKRSGRQHTRRSSPNPYSPHQRKLT